MADPWAAYSPMGQVASPPISGASQPTDPWGGYNPINPEPTAAPQEETILDKLGQLWPVRLAKGIAKGIYSGVTLPGDVYSGKTQVDSSNPDFTGRVLDLASIASPVAPRVATSTIAGMAPTQEALKTAADTGYNAVRSSGVEYAPQSVVNMATDLTKSLGSRNEFRAPETHGVMSRPGGLANPPPGAVSSTIDQIMLAREEFGHIASDFAKSDTERAAASIAKQHIDSYLASVPKADVVAGDAQSAAKSLSDANKNYSALKRSESITDLEELARKQAARFNSGMNIDNKIRGKVGAIGDTEKKSYGFSPEELARIDQINSGSVVGNTLRNAGNAMGGGGGLLASIYGLTGAVYNPYLAGVPFAGALMKKGGDYLTTGAVKRLDEATRMRSALGEAQTAGPQALTPAEQIRQSAMIKALLAGGATANQNDLVSQMLQGKQQ